MSVPLWVRELADAFWSGVDEPGPFPRCLRAPIDRAWPLTVVDLPRLRLSAVGSWLEDNNIALTMTEADRPLRGCLVARGGVGTIFIDAADDVDERRFSLAHEVAHFLREYWRPRREAVRRLGPAVTEVLDGRRPPRHEERWHGLIAGLPLGFHTHLLERRDRVASAQVDRAEFEADRLAFELLAPAEVVLATSAGTGSWAEGELRKTFGLPSSASRVYARLLVGAQAPDPLLKRLTGPGQI